MNSPFVAFIRDQQLQNQLCDHFQSFSTEPIETCVSAKDTMARLSSLQNPTLFFDARLSEFDAESEALINSLMTDLDAVNLIVLGDGIYPLRISAELNLLEAGHLLVTNDGGIRDPDEILDRVVRTARPRPIPRLCQVTAEGITVGSYNPEMAPMLNDLMRVAHRDVTLLIVGETGTGKTTLAKFIHSRSPRREKPFQHLACGALPSDLIESELFGHVRGSFTGAERNKVGRFQAAGTGTLLLDEIDILDLRQQSKLLKVIETGEYEPVGSTETRTSEARLIVASNVELEELAENGQFRADLYYRLNVLEFRLPPLRRRHSDIVPLAMGFIHEACEQHEITIDGVARDFLQGLTRYHWPGNLRELKNQLRRSVLFCESQVLSVNDLSPKIIQAQFTNTTDRLGRGHSPNWTLADQVALNERELLEQALKAHNNNRTKTAKALGLSRVGLYKKLRRLGLMDRKKEPSSVGS